MLQVADFLDVVADPPLEFVRRQRAGARDSVEQQATGKRIVANRHPGDIRAPALDDSASRR